MDNMAMAMICVQVQPTIASVVALQLTKMHPTFPTIVFFWH